MNFDIYEIDGKKIISMNGEQVASFETSQAGNIAFDIFLRGILLDETSSVWDVNNARYISSEDKD